MSSIKALLMALPLASMLFACTQEESMRAKEEAVREVELTVGFSVSSDIRSRACRPLESIDPWQRVTDMRVYVFRSENGPEGTFRLYYPLVKDNRTDAISKQQYLYIPEFEKTGYEGPDGKIEDGTWKNPESETHTYTIKPLLPDGDYRLLAVGFDDADESPVKIDWREGETTWDTAIMNNEGGTPVASEIFTGYPLDKEGAVESFQVSGKDVHFVTTIVCRRAVAGVLLYLKNIPSHYAAEDSWSGEGGGTGVISSDLTAGRDLSIHEVAIVSVGHNPQCNAVTRHWTGDFKYDSSRFKLTRLASISLNPKEADANGYHMRTFKAAGNFVMPSYTYGAKDNPLLAGYPGGMLTPGTHPFDKSLYLCFFTKTGSGQYYPLKMWPIKLVRSYTGDEDQEDECAGELQLTRDDPYHYNLVANHLYCLGMYKSDGKPDDPVDLKKEIEEHPGQDLTIRVIGSWQWEINIEM